MTCPLRREWAGRPMVASIGHLITRALPREELCRRRGCRARSRTMGFASLWLRPGSPTQLFPAVKRLLFHPEKYNRVYLLAAAMNGDQKAVFRVGDKSTELTIQE